MKRTIGLLLLITMTLVTGCGDRVFNEDDIKEFVIAYKTIQYTVDDPSTPPTAKEIEEKVKPYLSAQQYEDFKRHRYFGFIPLLAEKTGYGSKLKDVTLEKVNENDDGSIDYDYTLTIEYYHNDSSKLVKTKGQLTIQYDGDQFQITRDWEQPNKLLQEVNF